MYKITHIAVTGKQYDILNMKQLKTRLDLSELRVIMYELRIKHEAVSSLTFYLKHTHMHSPVVATLGNLNTPSVCVRSCVIP